LRKELEERFNRFYDENIEKVIQDNIDKNKIEDKTQITLNRQELYEDWFEHIESATLPNLEKVEENFYDDGIHVKLIYSLEGKKAKHIRKIKIKSNGKVEVNNFLFVNKKIDNKPFEIKVEYDIYGNLTLYFVEKK